MSLEKILSISGKPGLYRLTTQTRSGFLAESLLDNKTISVSARHNVSLLSEIAIYTTSEEVPLREIFKKISEKEEGKETINHKVPKIELEEYFFKVVPDYDEERVYPSDIKKVVQWYNLLVKNGLTDFTEATPEAKKDVKEAITAPKAVNEAPKSASPKSASGKKGGTAKSTAARKK
jgi:hypothetical protein